MADRTMIEVDGVSCRVERLPSADPEGDLYEVIAPDGFVFSGGEERILCTSWADVLDAVRGEHLIEVLHE